MPILKVENLKISFGEQTILENLSFSVGRGESLAIIGPNGSGKTVLLRALLRALPFEGEINWAADVRTGYVPQKIEADRHLPINLKNLLLAKSEILKIPKSEVYSIAEEVGIGSKILNYPIGHLSGGQFQKSLLAFALLGNPNVLLLDEPTASIDLPGEEQIYELVHRLQDKYNMTVIVVSHDLSFVYKYANKVLCLNKTGLCFGPPEESLSARVLEKLYGPHKYFHHFHHKNGH